MKSYCQDLIRRLTPYARERAILMAIADKETRWGTWPSPEELENFEPDYFSAFIEGKTEWIEYAKRWGIPLNLLATSLGLCQIMIPTAHQYGMKKSDPRGLYYAEGNLFWAWQIIKGLMAKYQTSLDILSAYNAGSPTDANKASYTDEAYRLYLGYHTEELKSNPQMEGCC